MKVSYFGYVMRSHADLKDYFVDMTDFVKGFASWRNPRVKRGFVYNGEQLFLLPAGTPSVFLFVQARDHEIIKKIEKSSAISVSDIHSALQHDESIGFASYVLFERGWFGIGCRVLSPRVTAFVA